MSKKTLNLYTVRAIEDIDEHYVVWAPSFGSAMEKAAVYFGVPLELLLGDYIVNLAFEGKEEYEIAEDGSLK